MKNLSGRIFVLLLSIYSLLPLDTLFCQDIETLIKKGLEHCYNFNWSSAEKEFRGIINSYPDDPRGYHYKSGIYLWYFLSSNQQADLEEFLKYSDIAIQKGEAILDKSPEIERINFTLGNAYSYRTLGYAKSESYLNAIWSSKKSEGYLRKVIDKNPEMYDAYLGLGLYNFAAAQIPSAFKWALNLAGISGDEETGIRYIQIAAEKGNLNRIEAQYYLSQLYSGAVMDYKRAEEFLYSLSKKYPSNILFNYALAVVYLKQRIPAKAEKILNNIIHKDYPKFKLVISFSDFLLGDVYFRNNEFNKALNHYKRFLNGSTGRDYKGIAYLRGGLCLELSGKRQEAVNYYSNAGKGNPDIEDDIFAKRKGEIFKNRRISDTEILVLKYSNLIEAGKSNTAYEGLKALLSSENSLKNKSEVYYYISEALLEIGDYTEALKYALTGAQVQSGDEEWVKAYCYYNASRAAEYLGKENEKKEFIEKAEDNNNSDYRNRLENLLKSLKKQ